jgi:acetyltransferase-like isoleucine patch superfamily enzyme
MRRTDRWLVEEYGYFENLIHIFLGLLPPPIRKLYYKLVFGKFGKGVYIGEQCYFKYPWKILIGDGASIGMGCQIYPSYQFKDAIISI